MRKNLLAVSIAAMIGGLGLAGGAHAGAFPGVAVATNATSLEFNGDGVGHSLLFPYFTVQNGQSTLITLVNHDEANAKALKVRFRGASNSDDVFDFTLFLSPGDVWTGNVSQAESGRAYLRTGDASCTLPASVRTNGDAGTAFLTDRLGGAGAAGTREGYIEVFNMADVPTGSAMYTAVKHVNGVAPCTAATFSPLATYANINTVAGVEGYGFRAPTTGLSGTWTIIDVPNATSFGGNATAVEARWDHDVDPTTPNVAGTGRLTVFSQTAAPVDQALAESATSDPLLRGAAPIVQPAQFDLPDMSTPYLTNAAYGAATVAERPLAQASSLTGALAVKTVQNEFYTNDIINGATDWVFSMPTRRYNVALNYAGPNTRVFSNFQGGTVGGTNYFTAANTNVTGSQICVTGIDVKYFNREEGSPTVTDEFVVSPGTPGEPLSFCGEASVLSFNDAGGNSVLSAEIARKDIDFGAYNEGWAKLSTPGLGVAPANVGLPILGASFSKYVNPNAAPGVAGNYGVAFPHKVTR